MRKLLIATGAALALAMGSAANATVTLVGSSMSTTGPDTIGATTSIGYSDTEGTSPFTEWLAFSNDLAGYYDITLTTSSKPINFTDALLCLGFSQCTSSTAVGVLTKVSDNGTFEFWNFGPQTLLSGDYSLWIDGTVKPHSSGSLGGSVTIAAVPEPATWAMMLLGFLGVGFVVSRRSKKSSSLLQLA